MENIGDLTPEMKEKIDDSVGIIQLVNGEVNHRPFWAYVSMYPTTYVQYLQKVEAHEDVNLEDFGVVIDKGWGSVPPQEVQDRMKEDFGADNGLQDELDKMGEEALRQYKEENLI